MVKLYLVTGAMMVMVLLSDDTKSTRRTVFTTNLQRTLHNKQPLTSSIVQSFTKLKVKRHFVNQGVCITCYPFMQKLITSLPFNNYTYCRGANKFETNLTEIG